MNNTFPNIVILFLLFGFIGVSCTDTEQKPDEDDETERRAEEILQAIKPGDFEIITIDSCQYVIYTENFSQTDQGFGFMAHKGNCSNPIHPYNK